MKKKVAETPAPISPKLTQGQALRGIVEMSIQASQRRLKKFEEDFKKSPAYAFEWSGGDMIHAARVSVFSVFSKVLESLDHDDSDAKVDHIVKYATEEVFKIASNPPRSTSVTANLMQQHYGEAWAMVVETIKEMRFDF